MITGMCSGWYMASTTNVAPQYNGTMGVIQSSVSQQGVYRTRLESGVPWCLDNGVFTGKFEVNSWKKRMKSFFEYKDTCLFVVIPDVVKDCAATLSQFHHYRSMVTDFPVAFVSQDGIYQHADKIPWNDFDCLFVGGSDTHKLGMEGGWIIQEAKARGKWIHIGRVNSPKRILQFWQADSWDGTHLGFEPSSVKKFHSAVLQTRTLKDTKGLFDVLYSNVLSGDSVSQSV